MEDGPERHVLDESQSWDDIADCVETRVVSPVISLFFPRIEEDALTTRRADGMLIALAVGLDAETLAACASAIGEGVQVVATNDCDAAHELLGVLRPRLALIASSPADVDVERFRAEASSCGTRLVCFGSGASIGTVAWLVEKFATNVFGAPPDRGRPQTDDTMPPVDEEPG